MKMMTVEYQSSLVVVDVKSALYVIFPGLRLEDEAD